MFEIIKKVIIRRVQAGEALTDVMAEYRLLSDEEKQTIISEIDR